jgi:hypothetical protein
MSRSCSRRAPRLLPTLGQAAFGAVVALVWLGTAATSARAYDRQLGLFVGAGYTGIVGDTPYPPHAVAASVGVGLGLGDVWELRLRADYAAHVGSMHRVTGSFDVVYLVDVLSAVPYLGLSAGGAVSILDASLALGDVRGDLVLGGLLGLDVLIGREWTVGGEVRFAWVVTDFAREPMQLTGLVRAQLLFEI